MRMTNRGAQSSWIGRLRAYATWAQFRIDRVRSVHRDEVTGFLYQELFGGRVFLRSLDEYFPERLYHRLCREVYFKHYLPDPNDIVVDVGSGYGHEALYLHQMSCGVRYIGVEVQPSIYECLANTLAPYRPAMRASPLAISTEPALYLNSVSNYEIASTHGGCVEVPTISWQDFRKRYDLARISLLKVNIEGGERPLLLAMGDLSGIERVVVGTHDFLADQGGGDFYRTEEFVTDYLTRAGFHVRKFPQVPPLGWLYADRS